MYGHREASPVSAACPDILFIYFDARVREYEVCKTAWFSCPKITAFAFIVLAKTILISQGSAATHLRCGGHCNKYFIANLVPNSTVKKSSKSVNICQSYRQMYSGPFFESQCIVTCTRYTGSGGRFTWTHKLSGYVAS